MGGVNRLPAEIHEALSRGAAVVTSNQRAARTLRQEFDRHNHALGLESWRPPVILAWESWTASLWRTLLLEGHDSRLLLSRTQEHAIWRSVLEADEELASLRSVDSLAAMASEAWQLTCAHDGLAYLRRASLSADTRAFQRWAQLFERTCRTQNFLSAARLEEALREAIEAGHIAPQPELLLTGFDSITPARTALVQALRDSGTTVSEFHPAITTQSRLLVHAKDESEELSVAARWIRTHLEHHPTSRIAVIVPSLETQRAEIDRVFREILAPELEDIRTSATSAPYEFSLGVPLSKTPMAAIALDLLRWAGEPLPIDHISRLLLSPYLCMKPEELGPRAEFDAFTLRKTRMLRPEISLERLTDLIAKWRHRDRLGRLPAALYSMQRVLDGWRDYGSHAEWSSRIEELLDAAGWGTFSEDSIEFQTGRRWQSALDELASLDFNTPRVSFAEALESLTRIAQQTIFAPESREAPVQIMGPLEAAGTTFDALWFLNAGDLSWPPSITSTPLLPWQMKRELKMPGTDIAQDTEAAQRTTQRIADSAPTAIFSFAAETTDGRQRASPALTDLHLKEVHATELANPIPPHAPVKIEEIQDTQRIAPLPDEIIHGGARILESQAACGFRAFAEHRLWSTEVEPVEPGMDARERGTLVHRTLEYFWDEVKTQSQLRAMPLEEREEMLNWCIERALTRAQELSETSWDAGYVSLQHERLLNLLSSWLELELERSPFEVKLSEKEFADVRVGPLRLNVRMDRVDLVEDGGEVLIDYKTGLSTPSAWLTERPDAPQLPLYAILSSPVTLHGVAFGLVRAGKDRDLKGYAVAEHVLPSTSKLPKGVPTLETQVEDWRRVLVNLAEEFASGSARVAPKQYPITCSRCAQRMLCRLDVSRLEEDDEDPAEIERG